MSLALLESLPKSRVKALLDHFSIIDDPRQQWKVAHPLAEVLLLVVCGTICDCDTYAEIAAWGEAHLPVLRRYLPYHQKLPGERWLTILMNRINPALFAAAFTDWVRETWPGRPDLVAIDGKTSRRSHDRAEGRPPLHLVSAFATTARLVLGQEAVPDKASETTAIPALIERLAVDGGLEGALISIHAIATNAAIAGTIRKAGANYLLAVKANQPSLRAEIERLFDDAPPGTLDLDHSLDKGHGRIEERTVALAREVDWLHGTRRFPGETRLPSVACLIRVKSRAELADRCRLETRYYVSSADLTAARAAAAIRAHWQIENGLHWVLDVTFADDQSRLRKGHGAHNMAVVRHFAFNLLRSAQEPPRPERSPLKRGPKPGSTPRPTSLRLRRKIAKQIRLESYCDLEIRLYKIGAKLGVKDPEDAEIDWPCQKRGEWLSVPTATLPHEAPLLAVRDLAVHFGGIVALDKVSFDVDAGQICGIIGPNGAGKTTLFNCLSRLYQPIGGEIIFDGHDLLKLPRHAVARAGLARTFQNLALFAGKTVLENVMIGMHCHTRTGFLGGMLQVPSARREEAEILERAQMLVEEFGLRPVAHSVVAGLPFGTRKRVELARALACQPKLLLLDEPACGLNHEEVDHLRGEIEAIRSLRGVTVLLVEHHMGLVMRISDKVVALDFGRKIADGSPTDVQRHPEVIRAYLGDAAA